MNERLLINNFSFFFDPKKICSYVLSKAVKGVSEITFCFRGKWIGPPLSSHIKSTAPVLSSARGYVIALCLHSFLLLFKHTETNYIGNAIGLNGVCVASLPALAGLKFFEMVKCV